MNPSLMVTALIHFFRLFEKETLGITFPGQMILLLPNQQCQSTIGNLETLTSPATDTIILTLVIGAP